MPTILLATGGEGLQRFNSWLLQSADPEVIFTCFRERLEPPDNFKISRLKLEKFHQSADESLDMFVNRCKLLANQCDFKEDELNERLVESIISSTPMAEFQKEMLNKPKGMKLCDTLGRSHEASANHIRELQQLHSGPVRQSVDGIKDRGRHTTRCKCCGDDHQVGKQNCPARNDTCHSCQGSPHTALCCQYQQHIRARHHLPPDTESTQNVNVPPETPRSPVSPSLVPSQSTYQNFHNQLQDATSHAMAVVKSPRRLDVLDTDNIT